MQHVCDQIRSSAQSQLHEVVQLVQAFLLQPVTPETTLHLENALADQLREIGRGMVEVVYNRIEADTAGEMPKQMSFEGYRYSRRNDRTNNREGIGTRFGRIQLQRLSYEPLSEARDQEHRSIAPLELSLGIVAGNATPALAECVGRAAAGHPQREVLELLEREHQVRWSAQVLRQVTAAVHGGQDVVYDPPAIGSGRALASGKQRAIVGLVAYR